MKKIICTICLMFVVAGCIQPNTEIIQRIPFPIEEYTKLPKMGTGTANVKGQAFLKTMIGEVRYAAGNVVMLVPVTTYSTQAFEIRGSQQPLRQMTSPDPRRLEYGGYTQADGEGRFEFKGVPVGKYYLCTEVFWNVPTGHYVYSLQGGTLDKKIIVEEGKEYNIILTR